MTTVNAGQDAVLASVPATAADYLGLSPERRYEIVSQRFPDWLSAEPIEFPPHHPTYGWACRVDGCDGTVAGMTLRLLCVQHTREFALLEDETDLEDYLAAARPCRSHASGWGLARKPSCDIAGCPREVGGERYCPSHFNSLARARKRGLSDSAWAARQRPLPPFGSCGVGRCVHDASLSRTLAGRRRVLCRSHMKQFDRWLLDMAEAVEVTWDAYLSSRPATESLTWPAQRGHLSLAKLPTGLQQQIRYALHRHAHTARRTQWRPHELQNVVDALASAGVQTLDDPVVSELMPRPGHRQAERRIWVALPMAARSLMITAEKTKEAGWFDPAVLGTAQFPTTQGQRRKPWDLTAVTQRWLRDLLWDHLSDEALNPAGRRPSAGTVNARVLGISLLSCILDQNCADHGSHPEVIGKADAQAVKQTWDLWFREQIPLPIISTHTAPRVLTPQTRMRFMSGIRTVLRQGRERRRTPPDLDLFILSLPEYPRPPKNPRPRPLSYGDFQLLVRPDSLAKLDALDNDNLGFSDLWLTQAFQGGRISETMKLRLGCIGLIGAAQPYLWRDITKVGVVDYGMPCYLPVYERLLQRQENTRSRFRERYRDQLHQLDDRGRAKLEAAWDREMPLFPGPNQNLDLTLEISQSWFREVWTGWLESLGLKAITTHQTRATLATSLLNNGAPPALVRQLLGHFSEEALAHYANYNNTVMNRHLQQVWAATPGMDKPGTILLRPTDLKTDNKAAAAARIDLTVVPVEHGLCRYGPVIGGAHCPWGKNCSDGPQGPCEHFVLTGADLAYWERKRDAAVHFAEGAPTDEARDYILSRWESWEPVLTGLREALDELGLLEAAEELDLRAPVHDYFDPLFSTGWQVSQLDTTDQPVDDNS